jgi:AraC family transcriptional regulator
LYFANAPDFKTGEPTVPSQTELQIRHYPAGTVMGPHAHEVDCLSLLVRGAFIERIGAGERAYTRGQIAYLPVGVVHSQTFGTAGAKQIIIRPHPDWLEYLSDCKTPLADAPHANAPIFRELGDRLLRELTSDDRLAAIACEGILLELVAAFARRAESGKSAGKPPSWLSAVRDYLLQHACAPLCMPQLARVAGRHEIHIAREFRRFFGVSAGEFARRLRIDQAARLLVRSNASISDIALESGFSSHSHLCREFKARFGVTPSAYRCHDNRQATIPNWPISRPS